MADLTHAELLWLEGCVLELEKKGNVVGMEVVKHIGKLCNYKTVDKKCR